MDLVEVEYLGAIVRVQMAPISSGTVDVRCPDCEETLTWRCYHKQEVARRLVLHRAHPDCLTSQNRKRMRARGLAQVDRGPVLNWLRAAGIPIEEAAVAVASRLDIYAKVAHRVPGDDTITWTVDNRAFVPAWAAAIVRNTRDFSSGTRRNILLRWARLSPEARAVEQRSLEDAREAAAAAVLLGGTNSYRPIMDSWAKENGFR